MQSKEERVSRKSEIGSRKSEDRRPKLAVRSKNFGHRTSDFRLISYLHLTLLFFVGAYHANAVTNSPYSRYGLGEMNSFVYVQNFGMGKITSAIRDPLSINPFNPASYSALGLTSLETGLNTIYQVLSTDNLKQRTGFASFGYLSVGVPITEKWGASFGLLPFSTVNYDVLAIEELANIGTVNYNHKGTGGISKVYIGNAYEIIKNLSIGLNASYLFGKLSRINSVEFDETSNNYHTRINEAIVVGDVYFDCGMQYSSEIKNDLRLTVGLNGSMASKINAKRSKYTERYLYGILSSVQVIDTVSGVDKDGDLSIEKGNIQFPFIGGFGFALDKKNKYLIGADLHIGQWNDYMSFNEKDSLGNSMRINIGGKYTPEFNAVGSYWKRITYSFGFHYDKTYLLLKNQQIKEYGINFGLKLPLRKTRSTVSVAFELGQRGSQANNLIQEKYLKAVFGFTFNDKWFIRRKFD